MFRMKTLDVLHIEDATLAVLHVQCEQTELNAASTSRIFPGVFLSPSQFLLCTDDDIDNFAYKK